MVLKGDTPPGRLCGSQKVEEFCEDLATKDSFKAPNTFGRARQLVKGKGLDVKEVLTQGFLSEQFKFFPNIKFRDFHRSHKLFWDCKSYIVLQSEGFNLQLSRVAQATLEVCTEVERRSLCYSSNLDKYRDFGMPWIGKVLERLPPMMTGRMQVTVLTFASSVGMIMNKDFVDYQHLRTLLEDMSQAGVSQAMLQKWRILSNFTLPKVFNIVIWQLHPDITFRLEGPPKVKPVVKREEKEVRDEQPFEDVQEVEEQDGIKPLETSKAKTYPASKKWVKWTKEEDELIDVDEKMAHKVAYDMYVKRCHEKQIPIHTYERFRHRRWRMLKK